MHNKKTPQEILRRFCYISYGTRVVVVVSASFAVVVVDSVDAAESVAGAAVVVVVVSADAADEELSVAGADAVSPALVVV